MLYVNDQVGVEHFAVSGTDSSVDHMNSTAKPPGIIHQPLSEEDQGDYEGLHPPKSLPGLTAAEQQEVQKHQA